MPKNHPDLTAERLREVLSYDPESGVFRWKIPVHTPRPFSVAGGRQSNGYWRIKIFTRFYFAHRLAWLYVHGIWPAHQIDHINGVRDDNRIHNLREATSIENGQNRTTNKNNTSGHDGVSWDKRHRKWQASIRAEKKRIYVGRFVHLSDAVTARKEAKSKLHLFQPGARE